MAKLLVTIDSFIESAHGRVNGLEFQRDFFILSFNAATFRAYERKYPTNA